MAKIKAIQAIKALIETATVERLFEPIAESGYTYWSIAIHMGKLSWFSKMCLNSEKELRISILAKFESEDKEDIFYSNTYEISKGIGRKLDIFPIQPQSVIKLAIVRRLFDNQMLYPIAGTCSEWILDKSYDVQLVYNLEPTDIKLAPERSRIPLYIKDGRINEL